jgi:hypothetical protein
VRPWYAHYLEAGGRLCEAMAIMARLGIAGD